MAKRSRSQARRRRQRKTKGWSRQREQRRAQVQVRHQRRRAARRRQRPVVTLPSVGAPGASQGLEFFLRTLNIPLIPSQIQTLAAAVVGALLANNCHLPQIAACMPLRLRQRSRLRRVERLLTSHKERRGQPLTAMAVMAPVARWFLRRAGPTIYLVLDFTTQRDQFLIAMVSLVWGTRSIPLAWALGAANTKGVSRRALAYQAVDQVAAWMPSDKEVIFIADREFRAQHWRRHLTKRHWHFVIRLGAHRTFVHLPDGTSCYLRDLTQQVTRGGPGHYWSQVWLLAQRAGPYQLAVVWDAEADEPWILIGDLPAHRLPGIYLKRWRIESTFRDLKSYGFDLEASRIEDPERFDRLLLILALSYGWAVRVGHWLDQTGQRHLIDRGRSRKQSSYRLGRYHLVHLWQTNDPAARQLHFAQVPIVDEQCPAVLRLAA
jgi:hypothetical protein